MGVSAFSDIDDWKFEELDGGKYLEGVIVMLFGKKKKELEAKANAHVIKDIPKKIVPYWRDQSGKIRCPGDSCSQKCTSDCPIWQNTTALSCISLGYHEKAIEIYEEILEQAPDFSDAWNNMAGCLGSINEHNRAFDCFEKAYELGHKTSLFGMAVAAKNLENYADALSYCDKYKQEVGDNRIDEVRADIIRRMGVAESKPIKRAVEMAGALMAAGAAAGFINDSDKFLHIPELAVQSHSVVSDIYNALYDYITENRKNYNLQQLCLLWCAFAGMGATYHWHIDWPTLRDNGIYLTLIKERGIFAMDEYVLDVIGIGHDSEAGKELCAHLHLLSSLLGKEIGKYESQNDRSLQELECFKAMFLYGMRYEMESLGLT